MVLDDFMIFADSNCSFMIFLAGDREGIAKCTAT